MTPCPQCQSDVADGVTTCPSCGTDLPSTAQAAAPVAPRARTGAARTVAAFHLDATRWSLADRICGVATAVLLVSLFLQWFNASVVGFYGGSVSGLSAHSYLYVVLVVCLALLAYLAAVAGWDDMPFGANLPRTTVMLAATLVNLVLVVVAFLFKPSNAGISAIHVGWSFGAFLGLIAAIAAAAPFAVPQLRERTLHRH